MNIRKAAQQALEALVTCCAEQWRTLNNFGMKQVYDEKKVNAAIAALHAALAEPEQEPVAWMDREGDVYKELPSPHWCPPHTPLYAHPPTPRKPQTTHWEGCEAVHPECRKPEQKAWFTIPEANEWAAKLPQPEHEVKNLSNYEFKTYKTGGAELEAGFYSTDELRDLVKHLDKMNAATERHMRKMK